MGIVFVLCLIALESPIKPMNFLRTLPAFAIAASIGTAFVLVQVIMFAVPVAPGWAADGRAPLPSVVPGPAMVPGAIQIPAGPFIAGSDRAEREAAYRLDEAAYGHAVAVTAGMRMNRRALTGKPAPMPSPARPSPTVNMLPSLRRPDIQRLT
jgi:hypothetical protein